MRVDVHTHIFPREIVEDRGKYFEGEPAFRLLYDSPKARLVTVESLLEAMESEGVDRAVTFGFPWNNTDLAARHNDYVLESAARYKPKLVPLACISPLAPNSLKEAARCMECGAKGLGELAIYGSVDLEMALAAFREIVDCCRDHRGILLVHANEPVGHSYPGKAPLGLDFFYALAKLARGLPLILAHWGGGLGYYRLLKKDADQELENVYYDTAASPFLYKPTIYDIMIRIVGEGRILFGSDYPLISPGRYFREFQETGLKPEVVSAISGINALKLFGA